MQFPTIVNIMQKIVINIKYCADMVIITAAEKTAQLETVIQVPIFIISKELK